MEPAEPLNELRWTRRKQARPAEIQEAALKVFAAKGYAAARMEDIATRAGVTKGTIYLYFANKEAVFKSLISDFIGATLTQVEAHIGAYDGPVRDLLRFILLNFSGVLNTDRIALPKIVIAEAGNFPELAHFYRFEVVERGLGLIGGLMARGIARGEFRALSPEHMARLFVAPMLFSAIWRTTFDQFDMVPYDIQGLVEAHLDIFFQGLAPEGAAP